MSYDIFLGMLIPRWLNPSIWAFAFFLLIVFTLRAFKENGKSIVARHFGKLLLFGGILFLFAVLSGALRSYHATVYVYAGDTDVDVSYDHHLVQLKPGQDVLFHKSIYLPSQKRTPLELSVATPAGVRISEALPPGLYIVNASGKTPLRWKEAAYEADYAARDDYEEQGCVCGGIRKISDNPYDVLWGAGKPPADSVTGSRLDKESRRFFTADSDDRAPCPR